MYNENFVLGSCCEEKCCLHSQTLWATFHMCLFFNCFSFVVSYNHCFLSGIVEIYYRKKFKHNLFHWRNCLQVRKIMHCLFNDIYFVAYFPPLISPKENLANFISVYLHWYLIYLLTLQNYKYKKSILMYTKYLFITLESRWYKILYYVRISITIYQLQSMLTSFTNKKIN